MLCKQIAKHFRELYTGGNWTFTNAKDTLNDISWQEANTKVYSFNTIASIVFHMNYFVEAATKVLQGKALDAHDKFSFDVPPILAIEDWDQLIKKTFLNAETFASLLEQMPDSKMWEIFEEEKYGSYYRNMHGIIENSHYHLGQIVIIKNLIKEMKHTH
jgi:hypothetical protein